MGLTWFRQLSTGKSAGRIGAHVTRAADITAKNNKVVAFQVNVNANSFAVAA